MSKIVVEQIEHPQFPRWYISRADGAYWTGNGWSESVNESLLMHDQAIATATCKMLEDLLIFAAEGYVTVPRSVAVEQIDLIDYLTQNGEFLVKYDPDHPYDQLQIEAGIDWTTLKRIN